MGGLARVGVDPVPLPADRASAGARRWAFAATSSRRADPPAQSLPHPPAMCANHTPGSHIPCFGRREPHRLSVSRGSDAGGPADNRPLPARAYLRAVGALSRRGSYASISLKSGGSYAAPGTPPSARIRTPCGPARIRLLTPGRTIVSESSGLRSPSISISALPRNGVDLLLPLRCGQRVASVETAGR